MDVFTPYQIKRMEEITRGLDGEEHFEYTMHATGILYLTIHNVVYMIDRGGGSVARAKRDGLVLNSYPAYTPESTI